MGFPRPEYWSGLPFSSPGGLPKPGIEPASSALADEFFTTEPPGKPFKKAVRVKIRSLGEALIQHGLCPYKNRRWEHKHVHTHRGKSLWRHREEKSDHLQAQNRGLRRTQPGLYTDLRFLASRDSTFLLFKSPSLGNFIMIAPEN